MKKAALTTTKRHLFVICALIFSFLCLPASGQYFGQNKVRYNTFDFKVLKTDHFDIYYYPEKEEVIEQIGQMAERWYYRLSTVLKTELSSRQPLILYADHPDFQQTVVIPGIIGESTGGVTESIRRRIVMPLAGPLGETDHVLGHELVHAFQYDLSSRAAQSGLSLAVGALPLWFVEGMAEYLSVGPVDPVTSMWMRDAVNREELPEIDKLDSPEYFPYRWGQAVWAFIAGKYGDEILGDILKAAATTGDAQKSLVSKLGVSTEELTEQWHEALQEQYRSALNQNTLAENDGAVLFSKKRSNSEINLSPVVSPDGRYVMLFSEKSLFGINIFMADARTGTFLKKITETEISPHFVNLQFTNAAGSWSSDSKRFAFASVKGATPEISIYDVERNNIAVRLPVREVGEIFSLSWSPDGSTIVFSAIDGGLLDLFTIRLSDGKVDRLTRDAFAELHPAWSPDGKKIAFATDRFTTDLSNLYFGQFHLALLDLQTKEISEIQAFATGKHINPAWSPDGSSLYFISDKSGIPNIYSLTLEDGNINQVTDLYIGVSGITRLSPAFSLARDPQNILFSTYRDGSYQVVRIDSEMKPGEVPQQPDATPPVLGKLPPTERIDEKVALYLEEPASGLTGTQNFKQDKYSGGFKLDYVTPVSVSFGTGSYGSMVGGGIGLYFSDMLNYHELGIEFQTSSIGGSHPLRNVGGVATYLNKRNRWTWGIAGGQIPYLAQGYSQELGQLNGQPVIVENETTYWQIDRQVVGLLQYPFNRAQRLEFSTGFLNLDFAASNEIRVYDYFTGEFIGSDETDIDAPDSLYMSTSSAAYVYDTSVFGGVSPVRGQRFRFEGGFNAGSLVYATALADYRRYFQIAKPLSLAGRVLHYGRYGTDAENDRMQALYLGYPSIVRGFEAGSLTAEECGPELFETGSCSIADRLVGSRIGVANAEMRLEVLGPLGILPSGGFPPVQVAPFYDVGVAWTSDDSPDFLGGSRKGISRYRVSLRFNIFGYLIGQVSAVHPNERSVKGWHWEFSFIPGF